MIFNVIFGRMLSKNSKKEIIAISLKEFLKLSLEKFLNLFWRSVLLTEVVADERVQEKNHTQRSSVKYLWTYVSKGFMGEI